jgi:DNA-nicking Smr family endonuclease
MIRKRTVSDEERTLFERSFREARPLVKQRATGAFVNSGQPAAPHTGIDGRTAERLRRGALEPHAQLDLHGLTQAEAHRVLAAFLLAAQRRGDRLVLVVTGKGAKEPDPFAPFDLEQATRARGVLKTMVPRWLGEPPLSGMVADMRAAHLRHGGEGALYVYLRKRRR